MPSRAGAATRAQRRAAPPRRGPQRRPTSGSCSSYACLPSPPPRELRFWPRPIWSRRYRPPRLVAHVRLARLESRRENRSDAFDVLAHELRGPLGIARAERREDLEVLLVVAPAVVVEPQDHHLLGAVDLEDRLDRLREHRAARQPRDAAVEARVRAGEQLVLPFEQLPRTLERVPQLRELAVR